MGLSPNNQDSASAHISQRVARAYKYLIGLEIGAVFLGSLITSAIRFDQSFSRALTEYPGLPKVFFYPLLWYFFLYQSHAWDRSILLFSNAFYVRIIRAGVLSLLGFGAIAYLMKYPISRVWVSANAIAITVLLLVLRFLLRTAMVRVPADGSALHYIYIGSSQSEKSSIEDFTSAYGFRPVFHRLEPPSDFDSDAWLIRYSTYAREQNCYGVLIGVGEIQDAALLRKLADLQRDQVIDFILATKIGAITPRFDQLESASLVRVRESSLVTGGAVIKRMFDIFFAIISLIFITPLLLLTAVIIKSTSRGPILYVDKRVGRNGKLFTFPKFRSMYHGADQERLAILGRPDADMLQRYKNDPRITPFGRFIRRWSIDELPQFWCVLVGTMSVVGPRPILNEELEQIPNEYQIRFLAKPGLTGLWQVTGRKEVAWHDRMLRDITYIDNWSFFNDLFLIWKTLGAIVKGQGAH